MGVRHVFGLLVVLALVAGACGGDDAQDDDAATTTTAAARADAMALELIECHQFGTNTGVDADVAGRYLSADQELFLDEEGRARFSLIAKDCTDIVVDGEPQGPGHFSTAWIRVTGPEETRTFPEHPDQLVIPTDYFHPVLFQTDNDGYAELLAAFGVPMTRADSMTFDPPTPGMQTGSATDTEMDPPLAYRWSVDNVNRGDQPVTVVHVLLGADDAGAPLTYEIVCPTEPPGFQGNIGTLEIEPGSGFEDLLGSGFSGVANGPDINCDVQITRG